MKYLIVSADDVGLSESITKGCIKGYEEGIVTSLNVIPTGKAYYEAMALLRAAKPKEIGAHLTLTATSPVTTASKIPTLITKDGSLPKNYVGLLWRLLTKKIDRDDIYMELRNQLELLSASGIPVTSLSSHEHIHILPEILEIFIKLAKTYKIPSIRYLHKDKLCYPCYPKKIFRKFVLGYFDKKMKRMLDSASISHADNFLGFLDSGNMRENLLVRMLGTLPEGTTELVTHPGFISSEVLDRCIFHRNCETDLAAVVSQRVKKTLTDKEIELITFGELATLAKK